MSKTERIDIIVELIARAFDIDTESERANLKKYLDLYLEIALSEADPTAGKIAAEPEEPGSDEKVTGPNRSAFGGQGGKEKRAIFEKLRQFREAGGLRSFNILVEASGGAVSLAEIHEMFSAAPYPLTKWRALGAALDKAEGELGETK